MKIQNTKIKNLHTTLYFPDEEIKEVLIAIHGFAGDKESSVITSLAKELSNNGFCTIAFDLPSHGKNSATILDFKECLDAVKNIESYVIKKFNVPLSIFATSFGAFLLINHLKNSKESYKKIILRAPAVNMDKTLKKVILPAHKYSIKALKQKVLNVGFEQPLLIDYKFYNDLKEYNLDKNYKNADNRYFFVLHGLKDDVVLFKDMKKFFEKKCKEHYKIFEFKNADHRFKNAGELEEIIKITKEILNK